MINYNLSKDYFKKGGPKEGNMLKKILSCKQEIDKLGIFLSINGPISQDILVSMGEMLRKKLRKEEISLSRRLKVFAVVVEAAQNIIRYSSESNIEDEDSFSVKWGSGLLAVGRKQKHFYVISGNPVDNAQAKILKLKLQELQEMNKLELKDYYQKQRRKILQKNQRGAGLGLIEIARRAAAPIQFEFTKINDKTSFFALKAEI